MLLDSNIIIYAAKPEYDALRRFIASASPVMSVVSYVEVLGYHKLTNHERLCFEAFFDAAAVLPITAAVVFQAVKLRQTKKMTLGDALIAATCLVHGLPLVTRNLKDFEWISGLTLINPFASGGSTA